MDENLEENYLLDALYHLILSQTFNGETILRKSNK